MTYYFFCPKCHAEISAEVDGKIVDWGEICEECDYDFSKQEILDIYDEALTDAIATRIDYARDRMDNL